jgi:GDPmannose 4,6-dehydratase
MFACTGILFNHESPLRPQRFVTQKIVQAAARISARRQQALQLGNLGISRDWGCAEDYVQAMWLMLQGETARDYVIATGRTVSLEHFVQRAFAHFDLDWKAHVSTDGSLMRPSDISYAAADPSLAAKCLGWTAQRDVDDVIALMCGFAAATVPLE